MNNVEKGAKALKKQLPEIASLVAGGATAVLATKTIERIPQVAARSKNVKTGLRILVPVVIGTTLAMRKNKMVQAYGTGMLVQAGITTLGALGLTVPTLQGLGSVDLPTYVRPATTSAPAQTAPVYQPRQLTAPEQMPYERPARRAERATRPPVFELISQ